VKKEVTLLSTLECQGIESTHLLVVAKGINLQISESVMSIAGVMILPVMVQNENSETSRRERVFHQVHGGEESEVITAPAVIGQGHQNIRNVVEGSVLIEKKVVIIAGISTADDLVVTTVVPTASIEKAIANPITVDDSEMVVIPLIALIQRGCTDVEGGGEMR